MAIYVRLLTGFMLMVLGCAFAYRRGDDSVRRAAKVLAVCWSVALAAQFVSGRTVEPAIGADVACGLFMLRLAWTDGRGWVWAMIGAESGLLVMHALLYQSRQPPTGGEILANNVLATVALVVLVCAALRHPRTPDAPPSQA